MGLDSRPIRLLVLEPSIEARASLQRIFSAEGWKPCESEEGLMAQGGAPRRGNFCVQYVGNHAEATDAVRDATEQGQPFAVVLTEFCLDGNRDGLELADRLWRIDPQIQVVIATADSDLDWFNRTANLPTRDQLVLLRKPFIGTEITQIVRVLVDKWLLAVQIHSHVWKLQKELDRRLECEAQLRQKAEFDALTRLPNRTAIISRLQSVLARHRKRGQTIDAILFLDLDNFKPINDSLGHRAGDELLNQVAYRLRSCVRTRLSSDDQLTPRATGEVARLGGDEFVVLLERLREQTDSISVAQRIIERLSDPFNLGGRQVRIGTSIGIAFADDGSLTPEHWLHNADAAMYRAKLGGKNQVALYDRLLHSAILSQQDMESSLRDAIVHEEFEVYYQPIYSLRTRSLYAVEALLRWKPEGGAPVPPSQFIPLAEQLGLINDLGYWTILQATRELQDILKGQKLQTPEPIKLSVNLSRSQLWDPQFMERMQDILRETDFSRENLKLEITESLIAKDRRDALARLALLQQHGFGIWLDDFGAGNLSLAFFHQLRVEHIKIDRDFVRVLDEKQTHQAIVRAVLHLAHSLEAKVIAEGLETIEQVHQLAELGCDYGQGYHFCPPVPAKLLRPLIDGSASVPFIHPSQELASGEKHIPMLPLQYPDPVGHGSSMSQDIPS